MDSPIWNTLPAGEYWLHLEKVTGSQLLVSGRQRVRIKPNVDNETTLPHKDVTKMLVRGEPGTGQISFRAVFEAIAESDYEGWVAAEYKPSTARTRDSLGWMQAFQE